MSADKSALDALSTRTDCSLRYFGLVEIRFAGDCKKVWFCVGNHAMFFVTKNMMKLVEGGQIFYAHLEKLVVDTNSFTDFLLVLNDNRPSEWESEKIFVVSEQRTALVNYIHVAFQTDFMWRFSSMKVLPKFEFPLRSELEETFQRIKPWTGYKEVIFKGYSFYVRDDFRDTPTAVAQENTGCYQDSRRIELQMEIREPVDLNHLVAAGKEHIRWVVMDHKVAITEHLKQFFLIKDNFYAKKMNLAFDIAQWTGWEFFIKAQKFAEIVIVLRRQYAPPLCESAQDFVVTLKCPMSHLTDGKVSDQQLLQEIRIAADSIAPITSNYDYYRDMIQTKLDTLAVEEETYKFMLSRLLLKPCHDHAARTFLKSILKLLQDENVLSQPDLITDLGDDVPVAQDPLGVPADLMKRLDGYVPEVLEDDERARRTNSFYARLARFFAYCCDGGLLGKKFTLADLVEEVGTMSTEANRKICDVLDFLVHIRPEDMTQPYEPYPVLSLAKEDGFEGLTFNDRVLQTLFEMGYFVKLIFDDEKDNGPASYSKFLSGLLKSTASHNVKAAVCRQLIENPEQQSHPGIVVPALIHVMEQSNVYIATYATVALVNLSKDKQEVKNMLVSNDVARICTEQLRSKVDDLIQYTLVLLCNITKTVHHREVVRSCHAIPVIIEILTSSYSSPYKHKLLCEVASVLGQLCNDEDARKQMCDDFPVIDCLLFIFDAASSGATLNFKLKSKVMFCLKQLCANDADNKHKVGKHCIGTMCNELSTFSNLSNADWVLNGLLLLLILSINKQNCKLMLDFKIEAMLHTIRGSPAGKMESIKQRLESLSERIDRVILAHKHAAEQAEKEKQRQAESGE